MLGVSRTALQACRAVGARDGVQRRHGWGSPTPPRLTAESAAAPGTAAMG